jgi:hypothetical protein
MKRTLTVKSLLRTKIGARSIAWTYRILLFLGLTSLAWKLERWFARKVKGYVLHWREVELDGVNIEVGEGAYVQAAYFLDTGEELSDADLDALTDKYQEKIYEDAYTDLASHAYDSYKYGE